MLRNRWNRSIASLKILRNEYTPHMTAYLAHEIDAAHSRLAKDKDATLKPRTQAAVENSRVPCPESLVS